MSAYGIPDTAIDAIIEKPQAEIIDHLYLELEKCSNGDIGTIRTLLISLLAVSLIGLTFEEVSLELDRVYRLLKIEKEVA
jgi:hypothetical protein